MTISNLNTTYLLLNASILWGRCRNWQSKMDISSQWLQQVGHALYFTFMDNPCYLYLYLYNSLVFECDRILLGPYDEWVRPQLIAWVRRMGYHPTRIHISRTQYLCILTWSLREIPNQIRQSEVRYLILSILTVLNEYCCDSIFIISPRFLCLNVCYAAQSISLDTWLSVQSISHGL